MAENVAEKLGKASSLLTMPFALLLTFQPAKPFLATTARKLPNTAFQLFGGIRMPLSQQVGHKPAYNAKQGALRFWVVVRPEAGNY